MKTRKIFGIRISLVIASALCFVLGATVVSPIVMSSAYAGRTTAASNSLADTTFPPPIYDSLTNQPSYVVNINDNAKSVSFTPQVISVPVGMTVIWFNNGADEHTVTTITSDGRAPPQAIDSDLISANDGSFSYTFTQPGVYKYMDRMDPHAHGIVDVGGVVEHGSNFDMHVGGMDAVQSNSHSVTLRFIPKTVNIPPDTAVTYQVSISNANGKLFSQQLDDKDGILDLELVQQTHSSSSSTPAQQFTTWGPDFLGEEGYGSTGTFHIQGPILNGSGQTISVTMLDKDDVPLSKVSDTFDLLPLNR